jgi:hypothetical protein
MRFFRKKPKPALQVVRKSETLLRLSDWQSDHNLCSTAAKVLLNPDLQLMLSVLRNEHPSKLMMPYGTALNDRIVLQARGEGYEMCLANLEAMARHNAILEFPEATFQAE